MCDKKYYEEKRISFTWNYIIFTTEKLKKEYKF